MTRYWIDLACDAVTSGDLDEGFLTVMDALLDEPGAIDPDITAELATGRLIISLGVDAETDRDALSLALVMARSAIHKAGGYTPDWGAKGDEDELQFADGFDARVRPAGMSSC